MSEGKVARYEPPLVQDLGTLRDLTAGTGMGTVRDNAMDDSAGKT